MKEEEEAITGATRRIAQYGITIDMPTKTIWLVWRSRRAHPQ